MNNTPIEVSTYFENIQNKSELRAWLMRAYFDPKKHVNELYYRDYVTQENVLEWVSNPRNNFPQTPYAISRLWAILPSLRSGLEAAVVDVQEKTEVYKRGEKTLLDISKALGSNLPMTAFKLSDNATIKLKAMVKALTSDDSRLASEADKKIENAITDVAEVMADAVQACNTSDEIIPYIMKRGYLGKRDNAFLDDLEKDTLDFLIGWSKDTTDPISQYQLETIFVEDHQKLINVFNIVQLMISKQIYSTIPVKVLQRS